MKNSLETRLGLFVFLVALAAILIMFTIGGLDRFQRGLRVHALFNSARELKLGDRVKLSGVEVGRVESIALTESEGGVKVRVTMRLRADAPVKMDSIAKIDFAGLMGQNFVSLDALHARGMPATNDSTLATIEQPDLSAIMAKLDNAAAGIENLTKSFSGDKINGLLGPLSELLKQNSGPLTATIANIRHISAQIAEGRGTVGRLVNDDALYNSALATVSNFNATSDEIKLAVGDARKVIDGVNSGRGTLGKLVTDEKLYSETTSSMTELKEILQKVNRGDGTVGKLVNDPEMYKNAKLTLQKLDKATEGLEDQGPLSVLGILVNGLF
jgi:phospholipid/cholesterol/gamma-HCH transport system substrate-binding protein